MSKDVQITTEGGKNIGLVSAKNQNKANNKMIAAGIPLMGVYGGGLYLGGKLAGNKNLLGATLVGATTLLPGIAGLALTTAGVGGKLMSGKRERQGKYFSVPQVHYPNKRHSGWEGTWKTPGEWKNYYNKVENQPDIK